MALNTTTAEADAKLHHIKYDVELGSIQIIRKWTEIDASLTQSLSAALAGSTTKVDPKVDNVTYSGTYYINIIEDEGLPDRSTTIYQRMTKSGSGNELVAVTMVDASHKATTTYKWHISLAEVNTFKLDYDEAATGKRYDLNVTRNESDDTFNVAGTVIEAVEQIVAEHTILVQGSESAVESQVLNTTNADSLPVSGVTAGQRQQRELKRNPDDTSDISLRTTTVTNQSAISYDDSGAATATITENTQAAAPLGVPTPEAGKIKRNRNKKTDVDKYNTVEEVITVANQTATSYEDGAAADESSVLNTQADTPLTDPTASAGEIKTASNTPTEANKTRTVATTRTAKDQTATSYTDGGSESAETSLHTQATSAVSQPTAGDGEIKEAESLPTEFGRYRNRETTRTAKDQTTTTYVDSAAEDVSSVLHTQNATPLTDPTASAGEIKEAENTPTDFNLTRTKATTRTAKDQTATSYVDSAARAASTAFHSQNATALTTPSAAAGEIKTNTNVPTEFGRYRTSAETITVKNQSSTSYEQSGAATKTIALNTEAAAALTAPTPADGYIKRNQNTPTEAGKVRTVEEVATVINQTATSYDSAANQTETRALNTQSTALGSPTPSDGTLVVHRNKPTEANLYETDAITRTIVDQETIQYHKTADAYRTSTHKTANTAVLADPGTPSAGNIEIRENVATPFKNRWDTTSTTIIAQKQDTGWQEYNDVFGSSYVRAIEHGSAADLSSVIADFVSGEQNSLSARYDEYGLLNIVATRQLSGLYRDTYFGEADDYKEWTTVKREYRTTSSDPGGYVWREITIHMRRYVGIVYQGGAALHGAWANLENPPAGYDAEADSVEPRYVGRNGGYSCFESILVYREYSAVWNASSTDSNP